MAGDGELRPYLERDEVAALQVRRGSLTDVERVEIEHHVVHTYNFLKKIPWGKRYADVPRIAAAHHEYLNGSGYPNHLGSGDIPIESRIIRWRFGLDDEDELTLKEIGDKYNLSRERIRQLQEQALAKMRRALARRDLM